MKKVLILFIIFFILSVILIDTKKEVVKKPSRSEVRALFVSYLELNVYIRDKSREESISNIEKIVKNTKDNKFNTIILQVRSYDDAIYPSLEFPVSKSIILKDKTNYDVLSFFIKYCKKYNVDLYLWINPYRITSVNEEIDPKGFAYKYKDSDIVKKVNNIYYYNPSSSIVNDHIIAGIKELVNNYKFKGILFDDYFYPSSDIDLKEYEAYLKKKSISKDDYHLMIINNMVSSVYKSIKDINKNVLFGISPDGNIENNYNKNFADVKEWCSSDKYIDFIMPQLYYGFYNSTKPFIETLNAWNSLITNKNIASYYALAFYKVGVVDSFAKKGSNEWIDYDDVIKKQIIIARNSKNYKGFSLFRYDYLFNKDNFTSNTLKEFANIKEVFKN